MAQHLVSIEIYIFIWVFISNIVPTFFLLLLLTWSAGNDSGTGWSVGVLIVFWPLDILRDNNNWKYEYLNWIHAQDWVLIQCTNSLFKGSQTTFLFRISFEVLIFDTQWEYQAYINISGSHVGTVYIKTVY